jgi:predicted ester cyclase
MTDDASTYRRIPEEILNQGKVELIDELFAEDYVEHAAPPGVPPNRDSLKEFFADIRNAFPDLHYEVLQQYHDGDTHIGLIHARGTMKGDFMGMTATGKSAEWDEIHIGRMAGGKLVEHWGVVDNLTMMQQLGLVPEPGA